LNTSATQTAYAAANIKCSICSTSPAATMTRTCAHFLLLMAAVLCCVTVLAYRFTNKRVTIINSSPLFAKTVSYASGTHAQSAVAAAAAVACCPTASFCLCCLAWCQLVSADDQCASRQPPQQGYRLSRCMLLRAGCSYVFQLCEQHLQLTAALVYTMLCLLCILTCILQLECVVPLLLVAG
jgi:hypothetical protein